MTPCTKGPVWQTHECLTCLLGSHCSLLQQRSHGHGASKVGQHPPFPSIIHASQMSGISKADCDATSSSKRRSTYDSANLKGRRVLVIHGTYPIAILFAPPSSAHHQEVICSSSSAATVSRREGRVWLFPPSHLLRVRRQPQRSLHVPASRKSQQLHDATLPGDSSAEPCSLRHFQHLMAPCQPPSTPTVSRLGKIAAVLHASPALPTFMHCIEQKS